MNIYLGKKPGVSIADGDVSFTRENGSTFYYVPLKSITGPKDLCRWIYHMSDKTWFDRNIAKKLIAVVFDHFKWGDPFLFGRNGNGDD